MYNQPGLSGRLKPNTIFGEVVCGSFFRAALSLSLLFFVVAQAQDLAPKSEPIPGLTRESLSSRSSLGTVTKHTETGHDEYSSELYDEEIKEQLSKLKKALAHRPHIDSKKLQALVAPEFQGAYLAPMRRTVLRAGPPLVESLEPDPRVTVTAETLQEELELWLAGLAEISVIEFKTTAVDIEQPDPPLVRLRIRYDLTARTEQGGAHQRTGHWDTRWRKDPERGWLWLGLQVEEAWEAHSPRLSFTDVTQCAIGKSPAYEQLRIGVDWWSANLDAATTIETTGFSGVAVGDFDADGREDFYVCQPAGIPNRLFRSNSDGTFTEVSHRAGVDVLDHSSSAVFFDYDNDGDKDLVAAGTSLLLFRNDGEGRFTFQDPQTVGLTPDKDKKTVFTSVCIADYNRDGWLDIYVCSYAWQVGESANNYPLPYHDANNGSPNFLFRNNGDGTFTQATEETGLNISNARFSFACAWADYDRDGWPDLYVVNDFGRNNLYHANGDGTFTDVAAQAGVEDIGNGMSGFWEDYDNDGLLDLYVSNMWSSAGLRTTDQPVFKPGSDSSVRGFLRRMAKGNTLFRNLGDGTFAEVTERAGVGMGRFAWGSQFFDMDLDGQEDIFVTNGFITNEDTHDL